jgi:glycosyltransferase involved in cell wall biosynthesis
MNVLYLSCHEVLEYDELRMLTSIPGFTVMPAGSYYNDETNGKMRPKLNINFPDEWRVAWNKIQTTEGKPDHRSNITRESVEPFDIVIVMHHWDWVFDNIDAFEGKKVVWRDIGQTVDTCEETWVKKAKDLGVKIVRYWDGYQDRDDYEGHDAIIPFGKFPSDYPAWTGGEEAVLGLCQYIKNRPDACNFNVWKKIQSQVNGKMIGAFNDKSGKKIFSYNHVLKSMRRHNVMWYGGTKPAPYTLGLIEAMLVGIPVFTLKNIGWRSALPNLLDEYQLFSTTNKLIDGIKAVMSDSDDILGIISRRQVDVAKRMFSAEKATKMWERFLRSI